MKKIPILFKREYERPHKARAFDEVTPGLDWVLAGEGIATVKIDGTCCAVMDGEFYRRYDAKAGRTPPAGAIPCCDPDPVTGHCRMIWRQFAKALRGTWEIDHGRWTRYLGSAALTDERTARTRAEGLGTLSRWS